MKLNLDQLLQWVRNDWQRKIIFMVAIFLFVGGYVLAYQEKNVAAPSTYAAGFLALIFVFLSQFKRFSAFGLEAETWEKEMEEAGRVIRNLQFLAATVAEPLFTMAARMGRWDSAIPRRERYEMMRRIEEELKRNSVPEEQIEKAKKTYHRFNVLDLARPVVKELIELTKKTVDEKQKRVDKFPQPITGEAKPEFDKLVTEWREASGEQGKIRGILQVEHIHEIPDLIDKFIEETALLTLDQKQALKVSIEERMRDLRFYIQNRDFRRIEIWFAEDEE